VQVHYGEGVAIRIGPKPCVGTREGDGEASAGECAGQPLSRESKIVPSADVVRITEGNTRSGASARAPARLGVVEDPGMRRNFLHGSREASGLACGWTLQVRVGKTRSRSR
jgi:hypothetical protein